MSNCRYPVILVHGWCSHPGVWKKLIVHLEAEKIPFSSFDHTGMKGSGLMAISNSLLQYLREIRAENNWTGPIDIVSHSIGTCIARYVLEVMDGNDHEQAVRQLIGIGPPNSGSAIAELFHDPDLGKEIIGKLTGVFVPRGFDPAADQIVQDVRPQSRVIRDLRSAGLRTDIAYRIIVTSNPADLPAFFPWFQGKTWELSDDGSYRVTLEGDGVVAHRESMLPGISLDILPASDGDDENLPSPDQYCHLFQPKNPVVIDRVMQYLKTTTEPNQPGTVDPRFTA